MILRSGHRKGEEHSNIHGRWEANSEILINIFEYLPLEDRKSAKLVCDNWYKILTRRTFQMKECIYCRGLLYPAKEIVSRLTTFRCPLYNLKLERVNVKHWPRRLWRERGNEIRDLDFLCCRNINAYLNDKSIEYIIEYCTNLTNWSNTVPRYNCFQEDPNNTTIAISEYLLDKLIEKKIRRSNLVSMNTCVRNLNQSWLLKLFTIFPEVKKLHLHELNCDKNVPDHNIFQTLGQYNYIRDSLSYWSSSLSMNELFCAVPSSSCTMLQNLDIGIIKIKTGLGYAENFLSFISKLTMLKSFRIEFQSRYDLESIALRTFATKLLHTLLDHCLDLDTLILRYHIMPPIILDTPLLEKLVKSKLVELELISLDLDLDLSPYFVNNTLKYLNITNAKVRDDTKTLWSSLVQIFQALIHCRIAVEDDDILPEFDVLEGLDAVATKLISLRIEFNTDDEQVLSLKFLRLSMFTCLKYLTVFWPASCKTAKSWLNLPNLEYLFIFLDSSDAAPASKNDGEVLHTIPNYSPKLKYLSVVGVQLSVTYPLMQGLCTSFSKLQFLTIAYDTIVGKFGLPEIQDLIVSSQSLRFFSLEPLPAEREGAHNCLDDIVVFCDTTRDFFKRGKQDQLKNMNFDTSESFRFKFNTYV